MNLKSPNDEWLCSIVNTPEMGSIQSHFSLLVEPRTGWYEELIKNIMIEQNISRNCQDEGQKFVFLGEGVDYKVFSVPKNLFQSKNLGMSIQFPLVLRTNSKDMNWYPLANGIQFTNEVFVPRAQIGANFSIWSPYYPTWIEKYYCISNGTLLDILISALVSSLFTKGISIHVTVQIDAFCVKDYKNKMFIFQEKMGICSGSSYFSNLSKLPKALELHRKNNPHLNIEDGPNGLMRIISEISISIIHTLGILQKWYGIEHFDTKCDNILLKFFDPNEPYFQNQTYFSSDQYFVYRIDNERAFYIPNRGFIAKVSDFSMARAHRIPVHGEKYGNSTTSMFFSGNDPNRVDWYNQYKLVENSHPQHMDWWVSNSAKDMTDGYVSNQVQISPESIKNVFDYVDRSKDEFGIDPETRSVSYDIIFFIMDLYTKISQEWFNEPQPFHLIDLVRIIYNINPKKNRPSVEEAKNPKGPLTLLSMLHTLGTEFYDNPDSFESYLGPFAKFYSIETLRPIAIFLFPYTQKPTEGMFIEMDSISDGPQ